MLAPALIEQIDSVMDRFLAESAGQGVVPPKKLRALSPLPDRR